MPNIPNVFPGLNLVATVVIPPTIPIITVPNDVVIVKKRYTTPACQTVNLTLNTPPGPAFAGTGKLSRSNKKIRFFDAAAGGAETTFNGVDNVFTGAQLTAGVTLHAEGETASAALLDVTLKLTLKGGGRPVGPPAAARMTAVEVTLDVCQSRAKANKTPTPLPETGAKGKNDLGRFVHVQDAGNNHGRAMLIVRKAKPAAFAGNLELRPKTASVVVFADEDPAAGAALANPHIVANAAIPAAGLKLWAQGATVSGALRDTGFTLGVQNIENDADHVALTAVQFSNLLADIPSTPAQTNRLGNSPVPRHAYARPADFSEDFATSPPMVLIENSVRKSNLINLSVQVAPVGVPVRWSAQRDKRPAPNGDAAGVASASPRPKPTITPNAGNPLRSTLLADAVGSFYIRPYVDCNENKKYDYHPDTATGLQIDREPYLLMNLILIRVRGFKNRSVSRSTAIVVAPSPPTSVTGVNIATGDFNSGPTAATHNDATVTVIGGGQDGLSGLTSLFGGWINNELAAATSPTVPRTEDVVSEYLDATVAPPATRRRISMWDSAQAGTANGGATYLPGDPAPTIQSGPVLDVSPFGNEGTGGNTAVGTEGAIGPPLLIVKNPLPVGERWQIEMWDSPGDGCPAAPEGFPAATLRNYRFNIDFRSDLCFWTNSANVAGPTGPPPDPACLLYACVYKNTWNIRAGFTFNAAGVSTPSPPARVKMRRDSRSTPVASPVEGSGLEVRAPISLNLLATDSRN